jgi:plastocyanin
MSIRLTLAACLVALALPAAAAQSANPVLTGVVSEDTAFSITLKDASGAVVKHLDPGTYTVNVHDPATIHNFHLLGPGVEQATSVEDRQDVTWTVTLTDGIYTYQCDPHASGGMKGRFAVGSATLPPPATQLRASVGPKRAIALRFTDGTKVTTVTTPQATIVVTDRSRTDNFHLTGQGVNRKTGIKFRGKVTWKLSLPGSKYVYRSDAHSKLRGSFIVNTTGY